MTSNGDGIRRTTGDVYREPWTYKPREVRVVAGSEITSDRTMQNLLVPSVHDQAFTAGITWPLAKSGALNLGYEFNPRTTLEGSGPSTGTSLTSKVQMLMASYQHNF